MWVADFFASGWSGGENDLTCLEEPLASAGIWGRGGVPRARQRGAWGLRTLPPSLAAAQQWLPVVWPQSRGQTSPVAGTGSVASSQPRHRKREGLTWG